MTTPKQTDMKISMSDMVPEERLEVVNLLTEAMSSNPVNRAVFQSGDKVAIQRQRKMFEYVTSSPHNNIRVAKAGGVIVGVICYCSSDHCQLSPLEMVTKLPSLVAKIKSDIIRLLQWRMIWSRHDHHEPHVHLGPIAVSPVHQGKGIGSHMMKEVCQELDATIAIGYLETDKPENVAFYERFGFSVTNTDHVLGATTWFMARPRSIKLAGH